MSPSALQNPVNSSFLALSTHIYMPLSILMPAFLARPRCWTGLTCTPFQWRAASPRWPKRGQSTRVVFSARFPMEPLPPPITPPFLFLLPISSRISASPTVREPSSAAVVWTPYHLTITATSPLMLLLMIREPQFLILPRSIPRIHLSPRSLHLALHPAVPRS